MADDPQFVGAGDLDDWKILPRRFEAFMVEVRTSFDVLGNKILPSLERIEHAIGDLADRVTRLEAARHRAEDRLAVLEQRSKPKRKAS
jgi:hypothetical protein